MAMSVNTLGGCLPVGQTRVNTLSRRRCVANMALNLSQKGIANPRPGNCIVALLLIATSVQRVLPTNNQGHSVVQPVNNRLRSNVG